MMKRTLFIILLFIVSLPQAIFSKEASVKAFQGNVQAIPPNQPTQPVSVAMILPVGSEIETDFNAYCEIALDENNVFRIKENTRIKISKIDEESEKPDGSIIRKTQIDLFTGELGASLNKLPPNSEFDVISPVAIAGASGTAFHVSYHENDHNARISVFHDTVIASSRNEPDKYTSVQQMNSVDIAPWDKTILRAQGRGILSEALFGKQFTQAAESSIDIEAAGSGPTAEEALQSAQEQLTILVLNLRTDPDHRIDQIIIDDHTLTEKLFSAISLAQVLEKTQNADTTFTIRLRINSLQISEILGRPVYGLKLNITPLTMMQYAKKFGAKARITTERAAKVEGYRNLAELIYGTVINSQTTVEDFAVKDDTIRTTVQGVVQGAVVTLKQYFSDGSILVQMEINAEFVPEQLSPAMGDVFGTNYMSSPKVIHFHDFNEYLAYERID